MKKTLISVIGPTAIGKTSLAIELANHFNTEILSADSRQFFKEMNIGTAKPTPLELSQAPHHFVDFLSIKEPYTAGQFEKDSISLLTSLFKTKNTVILAGGSGLYVKAITAGIDEIPANPLIREDLIQELDKKGLISLQNKLKKLDPVHYNNMDIENPQRLIRALEVCLASGKPYSSFRKNEAKKRDFNTISIGLTANRDIIYDRINRRVDIMINEGLIEEAKKLHPFKHLNALQTVGYKELFEYFENKVSKTEAIENIKAHTRQFAKRQLTWFKKDTTTQWFDIADKNQIIPTLETITEL